MERAVLCMAVIIEKTQTLPESDVNTRMGTISELKAYAIPISNYVVIADEL